MKATLALLLVALVANAAALHPKFNAEQTLSRNQVPAQKPLSFSWDNCGSGSDPVVVKQLTVSPDPLVLGQNITISADVQLDTTVNGGNVGLTIEKKIFGVWTEIPCVDGVGSCTYDNFCSLLTNPNCGPLTQYHIPCQCPFTTGEYSLPATSVETKNPNLSWLTNGDFYAKAQLTDASGKRLACYEVYVSLASGVVLPYTGQRKI